MAYLMIIHRKFFALLFLGAVFLSTCSAGIIYDVNFSIGAGSMTGEIVTDGNTGVLAQADITDWNLQLQDQGLTLTLSGPLSGGNSYIQVFTGHSLSATQSSLFFDFTRPGGLLGINGGPGAVCLSKLSNCMFTSRPGASMYLSYTTPDGFPARYQESSLPPRTVGEYSLIGNAESSSSTPEPSTDCLVVAPLILLAFKAWRRGKF